MVHDDDDDDDDDDHNLLQSYSKFKFAAFEIFETVSSENAAMSASSMEVKRVELSRRTSKRRSLGVVPGVVGWETTNIWNCHFNKLEVGKHSQHHR